MAYQLTPHAKKVGRFIARFPFVKFVGISGSLSKGYADQNSDFDFFIVTANNTLWICRTLLHILKKLSFIIGKQHLLCMNYFIDEQHLALEEQNIFTRIELSTLIPVFNIDIYYQLLLQNKRNLPNLNHLLAAMKKPDIERKLLPHIEKNKIWRPLNLILMQVTDWKWKRKWKKKNFQMENYALAFKTTPYISKNHQKNYQKNILQLLEKKLS